MPCCIFFSDQLVKSQRAKDTFEVLLLHYEFLPMNFYTHIHSHMFSLFMRVYNILIYFKLCHSYHIISIFKYLIQDMALSCPKLFLVASCKLSWFPNLIISSSVTRNIFSSLWSSLVTAKDHWIFWQCLAQTLEE